MSQYHCRHWCPTIPSEHTFSWRKRTSWRSQFAVSFPWTFSIASLKIHWPPSNRFEFYSWNELRVFCEMEHKCVSSKIATPDYRTVWHDRGRLQYIWNLIETKRKKKVWSEKRVLIFRSYFQFNVRSHWAHTTHFSLIFHITFALAEKKIIIIFHLSVLFHESRPLQFQLLLCIMTRSITSNKNEKFPLKPFLCLIRSACAVSEKSHI